MRIREIMESERRDESVQRVELEGWSRGLLLTVLVDPTERELLAALNRSSHKRLRGVIDGDMSYWWDAHEATHEQVGAAMGLSGLCPGFILFRSKGTLIISAVNHNDQSATMHCRSLQRLLASGHIKLDIGGKLVESFALDRVHENPSIAAIKALAERAVYNSVRFVIYKSGDFTVGDAGKFTHRDIAPAIGSWVAYGYVDYKDGQFYYDCYQPYSQHYADHPLLRRFEQRGIEPSPDSVTITAKFGNRRS